MIVKLLWHPGNFLSFPSHPVVHLIANQRGLSSTRLFSQILSSPRSSYMDKSEEFYKAMKVCSSLAYVSVARKLHAQLISTGMGSSVFLQNHLLHVYFSCDLVGDACRAFLEIKFPNIFSWNTMINVLANSQRISQAGDLFEKMPQKDVVSWNIMMSAYFNNGRPGDTVRMFLLLLEECIVSPISSSFSCVMKACASLGCLRLALQLHGSSRRHGFSDCASVNTSIVDMYIKCGAVSYADQVFCLMPNPNLFCWNSMIYGYSILADIEGALDLFYRMPEHDDVSWNTVISLLFQHGYGVQTLDMFVKMWIQGFLPNSMTYACVISACASLCYLDWGRHLHARILRMESGPDAFTGNALIDMYAKVGCLDSARRVFDCLAEQNVVAWTSLIAGNARLGCKMEALKLFKQMRKVRMAPDSFTIATVLGMCTTYEDSNLGMQLHGYTVKTGIDFSMPVGNSLITMYAKVGILQSAEIEFDLMPIKDIISWTSMITAFSRSNDVEKARQFFDKMPERNVVSWNSMMTAYLRNGLWEEGLKLYILMKRDGIKPDSITFTTSIGGCADSALLRLGKQIMAQAEKSGFALWISVANSAVSMYSKCGLIVEAEKVFNSITVKNVISWNSMMAGYAQNGQGMKVIEMFRSMLILNYAPDDVTYLSLLMGCSHAGLVEEACRHLNSMKHEHGICPRYEHYACMVDLLARGGCIEQALIFIGEMPFKATADIWGAVLAACRVYRKANLADFAARKLQELDTNRAGSYSLLANTYSGAGKLECVAHIRKMMKEKQIEKNPGCSWVEVQGRVNVFTADGTNHPQIVDILKVLEKMGKMEDMKSNENVNFAAS